MLSQFAPRKLLGFLNIGTSPLKAKININTIIWIMICRQQDRRCMEKPLKNGIVYWVVYYKQETNEIKNLHSFEFHVFPTKLCATEKKKKIIYF